MTKARPEFLGVKLTKAELAALNILVRRQLRKGKPADRSSIIRDLIRREHAKGKKK